MRIGHSILVAVEILFIIGLLLIRSHYVVAQELPLYPSEDQENHLDYFEYGVSKTINFEDLTFVYENTYENKTVICAGSITFQPGIEIFAMTIDYVITNSQMRIVRTVNLLKAEYHKPKYEFSVRFPFQRDYELGAIHINVMDVVKPESKGERLNV